ncbi:phosphatase PAP2 family protein [Trinickia dinghuensis]|uniref:Phosphatase PAP2 family protein n=1 Tax=Trinickia dinghuensis TaxID=2291023 RepID=A0A3D8K4Q1_9BURK|nr:phosphatase PAP2 family protein [Trinickia dinghuensis]RDU99855.1 phosphatase PAP2 family protein [Trinickia dinghuensis]
MSLTELEALNRALFLAIDATSATPVWLIGTARIVANDLIWSIPLVLAGLWLTGDARRRETALRACVVALVALGVNQLIGLAWQHPRPFAIGLGQTFLAHAPDSSFPSDHGTVFSAIFITLFARGMSRLGALTLVCGIAVAWARVFLGVHFPFDMIGAFGVAAATYAVITPLWNYAGSQLTSLAVAAHRRLFAAPIRHGWLRP